MRDIVSLESGSEEEYEVESIVGVKGEGTNVMYLLKWKGFSDEDSTWEPAENVNCKELLANFKKQC